MVEPFRFVKGEVPLDMSTLKKTWRAFTATLVARYMPWAFFYRAKPEARSTLHVECRSEWIDVVDKRGRRKIRISKKNAIYLSDTANFFDYFHGSATPIKIASKGTVFNVVDFSTPRFQEVTGFPEFPILCPSFTEPYVTALEYLDIAQLEEGDVVLDLGCYSGLTSIAFSRRVGQSGKVVALEPDPASFSAAQNNIARHVLLNKIDNIVLMNIAASSSRGVISFASDGTMGAANASVVGSYRGDSVEVNCLGLQDIADTCHLEKIDLIKIDIEGSELDVLAAAESFFKRFRPKLIVEPHTVDGVFSEKAVISILEAYGYRCQTMIQTGLEWPLVVAMPDAW
jgi:FkbM family methyltransferase